MFDWKLDLSKFDLVKPEAAREVLWEKGYS